MKYALIAATLLFASPAFALDVQEQSHAPFYKSIPAHAAVTPTFAGGDAEMLAAGAPQIAPAHAAIADDSHVAAVKATTATDAAQTSGAAVRGSQATGAGRYNTMEDYWNDR